MRTYAGLKWSSHAALSTTITHSNGQTEGLNSYAKEINAESGPQQSIYNLTIYGLKTICPYFSVHLTKSSLITKMANTLFCQRARQYCVCYRVIPCQVIKWLCRQRLRFGLLSYVLLY